MPFVHTSRLVSFVYIFFSTGTHRLVIRPTEIQFLNNCVSQVEVENLHLYTQSSVVENCVTPSDRGSYCAVSLPESSMPSQAGALCAAADAQTDAGSFALLRALEKLLCSKRER